MAPRYSLLHATFRAGEQAVRVRDEWLCRAHNPGAVEHLFAYDADDEISAGTGDIVATGVCGLSGARHVTAVHNWNAAAAAARGEILVVIADDLRPMNGWDSEPDRVIGSLAPDSAEFVVKITDDLRPHDTLIRHPVVSRAYFQRRGLWDPRYTGYGVDNAFTLTAHLAGLVIDGRSVQFHHARSDSDQGITESQRRMRADGASARQFESLVPRCKRYHRRNDVKVRRGRTELLGIDRCAAATISRTGFLWGAIPECARRVLRRLRRN